MGDTVATILNRRSVRAYEPRQIPRQDLETILKCGDAGPSGSNNRGWRFAVVQDPAFKKKLVERGWPIYQAWLKQMPESFRALREQYDKSSDPIYYGAPTVIFVFGKGMTADFDCPMACQNMMLAARSMGIGSCWVYIGQLALRDAEIRAELMMQESEKVYGPILLGYPLAGEFPPSPQSVRSPVAWK